jgi:hypothetical protein
VVEVSVTSWTLRARLVAVAVAVAVIVSAVVLVTRGHANGSEAGRQPPVPDGSPPPATAGASSVTAEQLVAASRAKVFFGHQSVGENIIEAIPRVYAEHGVPVPTIVEDQPAPGDRGFFAHAFIGENTKPETKIADFDRQLRGGIGRQVDIAFMKLCYVDVSASTDVDALFTRYRTAMAALERDFPNVIFLHVTAPLTTTPSGVKAKIKTALGQGDASAAENVVRERLNALIRHAYPADRVFDLAAVESTAPDGMRVSGTSDDKDFFALYDGYSSDGGHLNAAGADRAATALLSLMARTVTT